MVIADFDRMLVGNEGSRTNTWMDLSIKYDISESQAQNIVYKERKKVYHHLVISHIKSFVRKLGKLRFIIFYFCPYDRKMV